VGEIVFYDICKIIDPDFCVFLFEHDKKETLLKIENNLQNKNYQRRLSFYGNNFYKDTNKKEIL
jgi:hypothetical protein